MALGQAAGTAAHLAIRFRKTLRTVPIGRLRNQLESDGQILDHSGPGPDPPSHSQSPILKT